QRWEEHRQGQGCKTPPILPGCWVGHACFAAGALTMSPTKRRATGATTRTTGNAISQDGSQALIHRPMKPSSGPKLRNVAIPETRNDMSADRTNPKRMGA